jgi:hypothetical protein
MGQAGGKSEKAVAGRKKINVHRTNVFKPKTIDKLVKFLTALNVFTQMQIAYMYLTN